MTSWWAWWGPWPWSHWDWRSSRRCLCTAGWASKNNYRVGRPLVPKVLFPFFSEFPRLFGCTAALQYCTFRKHIINLFSGDMLVLQSFFEFSYFLRFPQNLLARCTKPHPVTVAAPPSNCARYVFYGACFKFKASREESRHGFIFLLPCLVPEI